MAAVGWLAVKEQAFTDWVQHTLEVEVRLTDLLALAQDAETGQRGYLLTGDETYLAPWQHAQYQAPKVFATVAELVRDNPAQQRILAALHISLEAKFAELAETVRLRQSGSAAEAATLVATSRGQALMEEVRAWLAAMRVEEERLLVERTRNMKWARDLLPRAIALAGLFALFCIGLWTQGVRADTRALQAANQRVLETNAGLEHAIEERTRSLVTSMDAEAQLILAEVTARQAAEEVLRRSHDALEEKVAERTRELIDANARLRTAAEERERIEEALRQSNKMEAIGQLTGGIAHDFNNMLAGISGSLELIRTRAAQGRPAEFGRYIETALASTNRAAALTHRLLAFARRQTLDPKPTNLNQLVDGMEELFSRTVGPSIQIEIKLANELWATLCDPHQLESALLNLVINARDAMPHGGQLVIETADTTIPDRRRVPRDVPLNNLPPGDYVALSVIDTGTGMAPEVLARAFDPFFTTKPLGQGTGLGLSMIHGFVEQSGGQVHLHSKQGKGARVTIYLPRHLGAAHGKAESGVAAAPSGASAVVLVVGDEPPVRMVVVDVLSDLGYTVLEAGDGRAGLSILESTARVDLLLTDVGLPGGMNGRQLADASRQRRPDLKVLFMTGYADSVVVGKGSLEGGMQVMTKPFALDALAARVQGTMSN